MSLEIEAAPRRGRPPQRNEILRAGRLGGLAPEALAERFGTPLYVYDLDVIASQVTMLQAVLPPVVELIRHLPLSQREKAPLAINTSPARPEPEFYI